MPYALPRRPDQAFADLDQLALVTANARAVLDLRDVADAVLRFRGGHWRHAAGRQTTIEIAADRHGTKFLICGRPSGGKLVVMLPYESRHQGALQAFEAQERRRRQGCCWVRLARRCRRWLADLLG